MLEMINENQYSIALFKIGFKQNTSSISETYYVNRTMKNDAMANRRFVKKNQLHKTRAKNEKKKKMET